MEENKIQSMFMDIMTQIDLIEDVDGLQAIEDIIQSLPNNQQLVNELKTEFKIAGKTRDDIIVFKQTLLSTFDLNIAVDTSKEDAISLKKEEVVQVYKQSLQELCNKIIIGYNREVLNIPIELCHENAVLPKYAHEGDAGFDFYLVEDIVIQPGETKIAPTGLKMRIPMGYELQVRPRSGMSAKTKMRIANAPGTIDCGYADLIGIICENIGTEPIELKTGDRIAQGVLNEVPMAHFVEIKDLSTLMKDEDRGGGFGSSGK